VSSSFRHAKTAVARAVSSAVSPLLIVRAALIAAAVVDGAREGAPQAVRVADRWHLRHNLGEAVERSVNRHHACLREPIEGTSIG